MPQFHVTSTINIEAESLDDAVDQLRNPSQHRTEIMWELLRNAEVEGEAGISSL